MRSQLEQLQQEMMACVLAGDTSITEHIVHQGKVDTGTRLHIYQNAYHARLKEVIEIDHSLLGMYLGDDLFNEMVQGYVSAHPSQYKSLRFFADKLPEYLAVTPPFSDHPVLSELARFERLLLTAFDAPDASRLTSANLQDVPKADWPSMRFTIHPSVQRIQLQLNTVNIWQALKAGQTPPQVVEQENCWLVWRNFDRLTEFYSLSAEEHTLIEMLFDGESFSTLCEFLFEEHAASTASTVAFHYLMDWVERGVLCAPVTGIQLMTPHPDTASSARLI